MKKIMLYTILAVIVISGVILVPRIIGIIRNWDEIMEAKHYMEANNYFKGIEAPADTKHAMKIWTELAQEGSIPSQCILGYIYQKGYIPQKQEDQDQDQGIERNEEKALYWLTKAAKGKCLFAAYQLGLLYKNAPDTEENKQKAIHWFEYPAEIGYDYAQYNLGMLYLNHDPDQAKYWLLKAAKQGHVEATEEIIKIIPNFPPPKENEIVYEIELSKAPDDLFDIDSYAAILFMAIMIDRF